MSKPNETELALAIISGLSGKNAVEANKQRMIPLYIADQAVAACNKEIAELRAQVAELKQQPDALTAYLYAAELAKADIKKLKASNKRLRDAGDNLVTLVGDLNNLMDMSNEHPEVLAWEAAKEGKPSV